MYVCICHAVTEKQLLAVIQQGAQNLPEIQAQLSIGETCGNCLPMVIQYLQQQKQQQSVENYYEVE